MSGAGPSNVFLSTMRVGGVPFWHSTGKPTWLFLKSHSDIKALNRRAKSGQHGRRGRRGTLMMGFIPAHKSRSTTFGTGRDTQHLL